MLEGKILPIVSIYGPNGGGKTAILESLSLILNIILGRTSLFQFYEFLDHLKNDSRAPIKWRFTFLVDNKELNYKIHVLNKICFE